MLFDQPVPVPERNRSADVGPEGRQLDDATHTRTRGLVDHPALVLHLVGDVPAGKEECVYRGQGRTDGSGVIEIADGQLDAVTEDLRCPVGVADQGANGSTAFPQEGCDVCRRRCRWLR